MIYRPFYALPVSFKPFRPPGTWVTEVRLSNRYLAGWTVSAAGKRSQTWQFAGCSIKNRMADLRILRLLFGET
jgi:hypothetical protein